MGVYRETAAAGSPSTWRLLPEWAAQTILPRRAGHRGQKAAEELQTT